MYIYHKISMDLCNQTSFYHLKDKCFYEVIAFYGDPEAAFEAGFKESIPEKFLYTIQMKENSQKRLYSLKKELSSQYFWNFFISREEAVKLLNKKIRKINNHNYIQQ